MDGREGMAVPGSASYYLNRGIGGSGVSGTLPNASAGGGLGTLQADGFHSPPFFKSSSIGNFSLQPNAGASGGSVSSSTFHVENPSHNIPHAISMPSAPGVSPATDSGKKKRGRPRKYGPDGANMSLALSPLSTSVPSSGVMTPGEKPRRGRPPGTGWKQKLAPLGEWMNSSAGLAFTPHVLHVGIEEDIAAKVLAFAQRRPRALCVLSANGSVSLVTLRQPAASGSTVTYEGRFEILCLSGSYLVAESGGPSNRTGGISISVCTPDGHIFGGAIGGRLIAATPVQVVICSFVYGGSKGKSKTDIESKDEQNPPHDSLGKSLTSGAAASGQNLTPNSAAGLWPSSSRQDVRNPHSNIDLMHG